VDDAAAARAYVIDLFRYVLERKQMPDDGVESWVSELMNGRDPIEVFRLFALSEENQNRRNSLTEFPHGHFYSPVVNVAEVRADEQRIFSRGKPLAVDLNDSEQKMWWRQISAQIKSLPFSDAPDGKHRYHYDNSSYGFGDASIYWATLATLRPSRLIEIGSGFSSALVLDAIDHFDLPTKCTFIDPYPQLLQKLAGPLDARHRIIGERIQSLDPAIVTDLGENDVLFIDSSHVVKTGSDVHFEMTELLPRLRRGVIVHFHDVFYPFEYHKKWVLDDNKSWNEAYYLQAFLMYNGAFKTIFLNHYFAETYAPVMLQSLPVSIVDRIRLNPGGGLWLKRR